MQIRFSRCTTSVDIKNEITEKLNKTHGGLSYSDFQEKLKEKLKENTKYVSDEDQATTRCTSWPSRCSIRPT